MKSKAAVVAGIVIAIIVIAAAAVYFLMFKHLPFVKPAKPTLKELVHASQVARYEATYDVNVGLRLAYGRRNINLLIRGTLTAGQDTVNKTYVYGKLKLTLSPGGGISYTIQIPIQAAYLMEDGKVTTCINMTISFFGKIQIAKCNTTKITSARYAKILEFKQEILKHMITHAKYLGTETIAGQESYCYSTWYIINMTRISKMPVQSRVTILPILKTLLTLNVTVNKICITRDGAITYIDMVIRPVKQSSLFSMYVTGKLVAKNVKLNYFNEKLFNKLLSLPKGPLTPTPPSPPIVTQTS